MKQLTSKEPCSWIYENRKGKGTPVFRREFELSSPIQKAEISICGLGQFALFVNQVEVNRCCFEPGWTDYHKTCLYSCYDITKEIKLGYNQITVLIGNGMYHVDGERYLKFQGSYGNPMMIAQLELTNGLSVIQEIVTDDQWFVADGPITHSCIYGGEDFDARISHWLEPIAMNPAKWSAAKTGDEPGGVLKQAEQPPVQIQRTLNPTLMTILNNGNKLYDFGRNFAGRIQIQVNGATGQTVKLIPGELLHKDFTINQEFTGDPYYDFYTLSGKESEEWMPRFSYYGLRYVLVETDVKEITLTGIEQFANCPNTGKFECSNDLYNKTHHIIKAAIESNMQSVFTDCPHREKLGWLEETHLIGPGILYNFDAKKLYEKILNDMEDSQTAEGLIPSICPEFVAFDFGFRDSPEWGSASIILPWYLYENYGDRNLLQRHYALSQRYLSYLLNKRKGDILNYGLGDWLDVGHYPAHPANTPIPICATALLYYDLTIMEKTAKALEKHEDQTYYQQLGLKTKQAFNDAFYYPLSKNYATGSQTSNALALFMNLTDEKNHDRVLQNLLNDIRMRGNHFTGGDIGHPFIVRALAECGCNDIIADVFEKTDFPSYGFQVKSGATTLCEDWDGPNPEHPVMSQNHFMLGIGEEWFYRYLAGIRVDATDGLTVIFAPSFPKQVNWVSCEIETIYGKAAIHWERVDSDICIKMTVPQNAKARILLNKSEEISTGVDEIVRILSI